MRSMKMFFVGLFAIILTACGGGGGGGGGGGTSVTTPTTPVVALKGAEGAYTGHSLYIPGSYGDTWDTIGGPDIETIVLENGNFYMFLGAKNNNTGVMTLNGLTMGVGTSSSSNFTSTSYFSQYNDGTLHRGGLSATYGLGSFIGNRTEGLTYSFSSGSTNPAVYDYQTPADMSKVVGAWTVASSKSMPASLSMNGKVPGYLSILPDGSFMGQMSGCAVSGTMGPRPLAMNVPRGRNVFNVALYVPPSAVSLGCPSAGALGGIAFVQKLPGGKNQLFIAVSDGTEAGTMANVGFR